MIASYPDANVYITAWRTRGEPDSKAYAYFTDPSRLLVASRFVVLEVFGKATFQRRWDEVAFHERLFAEIGVWVENDARLLERAIELSSTLDIANLDALHIAAAERAGAREFVTTDRPGRPIYRAAQVGPTFLGDL